MLTLHKCRECCEERGDTSEYDNHGAKAYACAAALILLTVHEELFSTAGRRKRLGRLQGAVKRRTKVVQQCMFRRKMRVPVRQRVNSNNDRHVVRMREPSITGSTDAITVRIVPPAVHAFFRVLGGLQSLPSWRLQWM